MGAPFDIRTTIIILQSYYQEPSVSVTASNNATVTKNYDSSSGILTLRVISNGVVYLHID